MRLLVGVIVATSGALLTGASCSNAAHVLPAQSTSASDTVGARTAVIQLEKEARVLARADGCNDAVQCRTAPVGARSCGGPRTYIAYCAATTDSAALFRKLNALKVAEMQYNKGAGLMSTCEFRMPPEVAVQGGSCKATSP